MGGHWNSKNEKKQSALNYLMRKLDSAEGQMFAHSHCFVIWWIKKASDQVSFSPTFLRATFAPETYKYKMLVQETACEIFAQKPFRKMLGEIDHRRRFLQQFTDCFPVLIF